ncbi:MAG: methyltransferase domain-containing protein [Coleofasciculus sp. C3-bin4]|nr:methyltransferase domain-containing protein [Coleofasciculus sp. C3-bin4]
MLTGSPSILTQYLESDSNVDLSQGTIPTCQIPNHSPAIQANSYYFGHSEWAKNYFEACHRDDKFKARWRSAIGSWDNKVVVDIGCGPGNLYASLGGSPQVLIGVDVSYGALEMAQRIGYTPLLADAHHLPFIAGFADVVALNATLHHCDDMAQVLAQAARLVRPGGILVTDHDPQRSAWDYKGIALFLWQMRLPWYRLIKRGGHASAEEQKWSLAGEVHHKPGDGMTPDLYYQTLEPLGFTVKLYPHNHTVGAEVLQGNYGRAAWKYRFEQRLSGIKPDSPEAALSLMCIAKRSA